MKNREKEIYEILSNIIDNPKCELKYNNMYELIIAVILSAQCTDSRVNLVTKDLFAKYPTVYDLAEANENDVRGIIHSLGFYSSKAKNIISCAKGIVERYGGKVPNTLEELITLSGVGRKTASVVLSEGYKIPAIAVDTHVLRVSDRLNLSDKYDPVVTENNLKHKFDENLWCDLHTRLVLFGRYYCTSRNPKCDNCKLKKYCRYKYKK